MPSPKSGNAGSAVSPADPKKAEDADKADPGEVDKVKAEQQQNLNGKYGSAQVKPYEPPQNQKEKEKKQNWIEIELVDDQKEPVAGELYYLTLPNGSIVNGTLDEKGFAHITLPEPGICKVTFPKIDAGEWQRA